MKKFFSRLKQVFSNNEFIDDEEMDDSELIDDDADEYGTEEDDEADGYGIGEEDGEADEYGIGEEDGEADGYGTEEDNSEADGYKREDDDEADGYEIDDNEAEGHGIEDNDEIYDVKENGMEDNNDEDDGIEYHYKSGKGDGTDRDSASDDDIEADDEAGENDDIKDSNNAHEYNDIEEAYKTGRGKKIKGKGTFHEEKEGAGYAAAGKDDDTEEDYTADENEEMVIDGENEETVDDGYDGTEDEETDYEVYEDDGIEEDEEVSADEDMDGDYGDGNSWKENRRIYRHKRRVRNQIIAYAVVFILVSVLAAAGVGIGKKVSVLIKEKHKNDIKSEQQDGDDEDGNGNPPEEIVVEAPPEIEESTLDEQLEEIVNNCISVMPLQDKVAGLFVITPEAFTGVGTAIQAGEGTQEALNNYAVGGLIYFSDNIKDREQLSQMLSNTVSMSKYPIFLAVDEEGGAVSRVADSSIEVVKVDDMLTIGEGGDTAAAYEAGVIIGSYLHELGFNLDFAPVADVVTDKAHSPLKDRSFGAEPSLCADMVSNMVEGIQGTSVSACLKHFPGIGSAVEDTHDGRVETSRTLEEMRAFDFIPFQAGIEAGADLVMVSHVTASAVDTDGLPSSLSKTMITDVLRGELGFDGVVITDALNMGAISDYYTSAEAAVNAIIAGADMLLMPEDFTAAYDGLLAAVQDGRISEERVDESLRRIYRIKYADKLNMD